MADYEGGFTFDSQGGSQKPAGSGNVIPVTFKQLSEAFTNSPASGSLYIDSVATGHIAICGKIASIDKKNTFFFLTLDDGTGSAEVRIFRQGTDDEESATLSAKEGDYVTCVAAVKTFNDKWQMNTTSVNPVTDFNHVIFHQMQALQAHLKATGAKPTGGAGGAKDESKTTTGADLFVSDEDTVYKVLGELGVMCPDGVPTEQVASKANMPLEEVREKIQDLITTGKAWLTMDNHYLVL